MARHLATVSISASTTILTLTQAAILDQVTNTTYLLVQIEGIQSSQMEHSTFKQLRSRSISCSETRKDKLLKELYT